MMNIATNRKIVNTYYQIIHRFVENKTNTSPFLFPHRPPSWDVSRATSPLVIPVSRLRDGIVLSVNAVEGDVARRNATRDRGQV